jgi:class 3 adenylate cyclase/tetratricopeptide (TPR) repeat protein
MEYQPRPIPTADVTLTEPLAELTERLAENAHEHWARQRLADGWVYGPVRDDARKEHPCLVPYGQLPESEKQYDRLTAMETLKAVLALGYTITPPAKAGPPAAGAEPAVSGAEQAALRANLDEAGMSLAALLDLERKLSTFRRLGATLPEVDRALGERLLRLGEPLLAYDVVTESLRSDPGGGRDQRLRQLQALALARVGDTGTAMARLEELVREPHDDPALLEETLGILARTYKDLGARCAERDPGLAASCFTKALAIYRRAYDQTGGYYPGINAATLALLLDDPAQARDLAGRVREGCRAEPDRVNGGSRAGDEYWLTATLGEAELILGRTDEARGWYRRAKEIGTQARRFGDMGSTFTQAERLLLPRLGLPRSVLKELFPMPGVAVFVGHMIDRPGRPNPRFPQELEGHVKEALRRWLDEAGVLIGYASAACGSDLLFLEAVLERGGEAQVVLPYRRDLFRQDSVDLVPGSDWGERYERVLGRAKVREVSGHRLGDNGVSYDYANQVLHGLAKMHAGQLGVALSHLAVWDRRPGDAPGGTASTVERWQASGYDVAVIDLTTFQGHRPAAPAAAAPPPPPEPTAPGLVPEIAVYLFGDVVGFSKLEEPQLPPFRDHFLGLIARLIDELPGSARPFKRNTWGDAVYLVFPGVGAAGRFALDLRDQIAATDWSGKGLPGDLSMRIGLHAGPAYRCEDPVTKRPRFLGRHISHAARIEPIAPPGQVYASEAFAALAASARVPDFACRYIGQMPLAKGYGIYPTYHVQRRV